VFILFIIFVFISLQLNSVPHSLILMVELHNVLDGALVDTSRLVKSLATLDSSSPNLFQSSMPVEQKDSGIQVKISNDL